MADAQRFYIFNKSDMPIIHFHAAVTILKHCNSSLWKIAVEQSKSQTLAQMKFASLFFYIILI